MTLAPVNSQCAECTSEFSELFFITEMSSVQISRSLVGCARSSILRQWSPAHESSPAAMDLFRISPWACGSRSTRLFSQGDRLHNVQGSDGSGRTPLFSRARLAASTRLAWPGLGSGTRRWPTIGTPEEAKSLALVFDAKGRKLMMEQLQAMEDQQQDTAGKLKSVDVRLSFVIIYTTQCN